MGLDMYLTGRRTLKAYEYVGNGERVENKKTSLVVEALELPHSEVLHQDIYGVTIELTLGYWRKANAVHGWFVNNVQDGVDNCGSYPVERESLMALRNACNSVLAEKDNPDDEFRVETANSYLPSASGFFFGSTDIDEYYYGKLEYTVKMIDELLSDSYEEYEFEYCSSW